MAEPNDKRMLDLKALSERVKLTVEPPQHEEERQLLLAVRKRRYMLQDIKSTAMFALIALSVIGLSLWAVYVLLVKQTANSYEREWAATIITVVISGVISFVLGEQIGKHSKDK